VLVVEDVDDRRDGIAATLTALGYVGDTRAGPQDALALFAERGPAASARVLTRPCLVPRHDPSLWLDQRRATTAAPIVIMTRRLRTWCADSAARGDAGLLAEPCDQGELVNLVPSLVPLSAEARPCAWPQSCL
jgi:CheY-like chemotaxis protein